MTCESSSVDPLEDPVLNSYCKCLSADLLCVWRRVKTSPEPHGRQFNDNQLNYTKELWVFWYGEEPDLTDLVANELTGLYGLFSYFNYYDIPLYFSH
jgi:mediator of RNA polymerase II transcription subunit 13